MILLGGLLPQALPPTLCGWAWFCAAGHCMTGHGGSGSYDEFWGMTEDACFEECRDSPSCVAFEFALVGSSNEKRCELHKDAAKIPTHGVPSLGNAGERAKCYVKATQEARNSWKGKRSPSHQVAGSGGSASSSVGGGVSSTLPAQQQQPLQQQAV
eukprot:CAMPEP_0183353650 /NCGR_PEP_ID=MMETSP0164_2-20130417/34307_1 /TAXON_ID=221442 /ORGANISM="Coccolithus pelagicus ssp braarudi, Strain PLY182g" /LENGTH=155 /DNA_ID=CAMNT_0025526355 /DNA_START=56 /DNA_END=519 /DNA_ORIENTATION=-